MSDVREVNDLIRRRNLAALPKIELIDRVVELETDLHKLNQEFEIGALM